MTITEKQGLVINLLTGNVKVNWDRVLINKTMQKLDNILALLKSNQLNTLNN